MAGEQPEEVKPSSISVEEAVARMTAGRQSADAPPAGEQPDAPSDGDEPDATNLDAESDAGGDDADDLTGEDAGIDPDGQDVDDGIESDDEDPLVLVPINGEDVEIRYSELVAGYQRQKDYTQKTQAVADQRRQVEQERGELKEQRDAFTQEQEEIRKKAEQYDVALEGLQKALKDTDSEWNTVDWDKLREEEPDRAMSLWIQYQQHKERKAEVDAEAKRREAERADEAKKAREGAIHAFQKAVAQEFPDWSDAAVRTREWGAMEKVARDLGFTDQEIRATTDVRVMKLLALAAKNGQATDAKQRAKSAAQTGKRSKGPPAKVVAPGGAAPATRSSRARTGTADVRSASAQFHKTRSINDAAALLRAQNQAAAQAARRR